MNAFECNSRDHFAKNLCQNSKQYICSRIKVNSTGRKYVHTNSWILTRNMRKKEEELLSWFGLVFYISVRRTGKWVQMPSTEKKTLEKKNVSPVVIRLDIERSAEKCGKCCVSGGVVLICICILIWRKHIFEWNSVQQQRFVLTKFQYFLLCIKYVSASMSVYVLTRFFSFVFSFIRFYTLTLFLSLSLYAI